MTPFLAVATPFSDPQFFLMIIVQQSKFFRIAGWLPIKQIQKLWNLINVMEFDTGTHPFI